MIKIVAIGIALFLGLMIGINYLIDLTTTPDKASPFAPLLYLVSLGSMVFTATSAFAVAYGVKNLFFKNTLGAESGDKVDDGWQALGQKERTRWVIGVIVALSCALIVSVSAEGEALPLSDESVDMIVYYEVGGKAYYVKRLQRPTVPAWRTTASGVTVGFGYDCGYNSKSQIAKDWAGIIPLSQIRLLQSVSGLKGSRAYYANRAIRDSVSISYKQAEAVFRARSLPRFSKLTKRAFNLTPTTLQPHSNGALVSLVFNRGSDMGRRSSRREMRWIKYNISVGREDRVPSDIRSMKRLWSYKKLRGLHLRRDAEARMFQRGLACR